MSSLSLNSLNCSIFGYRTLIPASKRWFGCNASLRKKAMRRWVGFSGWYRYFFFFLFLHTVNWQHSYWSCFWGGVSYFDDNVRDDYASGQLDSQVPTLFDVPPLDEPNSTFRSCTGRSRSSGYARIVYLWWKLKVAPGRRTMDCFFVVHRVYLAYRSSVVVFHFPRPEPACNKYQVTSLSQEVRSQSLSMSQEWLMRDLWIDEASVRDERKIAYFVNDLSYQQIRWTMLQSFERYPQGSCEVYSFDETNNEWPE